MVTLSMVWLLSGIVFAQSTGDTGVVTPTETGGPADTGATTTWTWTGIDTGTPPACTDCYTAAELAGETGGSPCDDGCSTGPSGAAPLLVLLLPLLYRRSYST